MALVPAKCTQCGGNIEVDNTHEAGICQHCGTPFITEKAINNYTTNITNNIVNNNNFDGANVIIENDNLEQLNSRAETFMKLEEYTKAEKVYREISEKYPMDYRGWLGIITTETENFTKISTWDYSHDKIIKNFEKAIKVANPEQQELLLQKKHSYEKQYKEENERIEHGKHNAQVCNLYNYKDVEKVLGCKCLTSSYQTFESFTFVLGNIVECYVSYMGMSYKNGEYKPERQHTTNKLICEKNVDRTNIEELLSGCSRKSVSNGSSGGCYIATCVYGSYDCPQVWTLRRYRDYTLDETWYGRLFIKCYYTVSPKLVKWFGNYSWFRKPWKKFLDGMVERLNSEGVADTKYSDKY